MSTKRIVLIAGVGLLIAGAAGAAVWQWRRTRPPARGSWTAVVPPPQKTAAIAGGRPEMVLQTGHLDRVASIAFNPDSTLIASSSDDGTVKLWEVATRRELRSFAAPDNVAPAVSFSADGQWVAASGERFRAWAVATGKSTDEELRPNWKAGSPNGQWRAGETEAGILLSQDSALGGATHAIPRAQAGTYLTPIFSPDGRWLAVEEERNASSNFNISDLSHVRAAASNDTVEASIAIWEVGTWRQVAVMSGRRPLNADPVFSRDGKWLAMISDGRRQVELWDVAQGKQVRVLQTPVRVSVVAFSPDSRLVLTAADSYLDFLRGLDDRKNEEKDAKEAADPSGLMLLWDLATDAAPRTINAGTGIQSVAFSADSRKIAVAGDHGVTYWDAENASAAATVVDSSKCSGVAFSPDNQRIAWAAGNEIKMRELSPAAEIVVMSSPLMPVDLAAFSPDGHWLATTNQDFASDISGRVRLWDIGTGREAHTLASDATSLRSMFFSSSSRHLVTFGERVAIWDTSSGQTLQPPEELGPPPPYHLTSADGSTMAYGPDASGVLFVQTGDSKGAHEIKTDGPVEYMSLSADGRWLSASGCDYTPTGTPANCSMRLWDTTTRKKVRAWDENAFNLVVSPDGHRLAAAGGAGRPALQVWDIATGKTELSVGTHLFGSEGVVNATAFSADSRLVAFSNDRHAIEIWDIATSKQIALLAGHTSIVGYVAFLADGRVLSTSYDGTIRLWNPAANELLVTLVFLKDQKQWLAVAPSGLFDGSPDAWTHLLWRFHGNTFDVTPVDTFVNEFYHPGLLGEIFAGQHPAPPRDIAQIDRRQPAIRLAATPIDARMTRLRVTVDDSAAAGGATGAKDVRLFRNGALVKAWRGDVMAGQRQVALTADVPIAAGENRFSAYVFNRDNVKSQDATLTLTGTGAARKGTAYVITIGVNQYANPTFNLKFAVADAMRFGEQFKTEQEKIGRFDEVRIVPLLDANATKANILHTLNRLAGVSDVLAVPPAADELPAADPEDGVFIFFAGHGVADGDRFYLVPHDLGFAGARDTVDAAAVRTIGSRSISDQELERALESVDAAQLLLVIDACNSGQALEAEEKRQGPMNSKGLAQLAYDKGMYVLTAAQSYQSAMETARLGHGLLTYALVEAGLAAREADVAPKDGTILMREWLDFAADKVPTLQLDLIKDSRSGKLATVPAKTEPELPNVQRPRVFYRRELDLQPLVIARK